MSVLQIKFFSHLHNGVAINNQIKYLYIEPSKECSINGGNDSGGAGRFSDIDHFGKT